MSLSTMLSKAIGQKDLGVLYSSLLDLNMITNVTVLK